MKTHHHIKLAFSIIIALGLLYWFNRVLIKEYFLKQHVIFWSPNVEIKYEDFQEEPDVKSNLNTNYYHGFNLVSRPICEAHVRAFFDKNKSWAKDTTKYNFQSELKLQKLGFNLIEVYARKFNEEIDKVKCHDTTDFADLEKIGDEIFGEYELIKSQIFYDETKSNDQIILEWEPKINEMLQIHK